MIPAWILTAVVVLLSCIAAIWIGSTLSELDWYFAGEVICLVVACVLCMSSNNFPLLFALGCWTPFAPPIPGFSNFPASAVVAGWMSIVLFFRLAMKGSIPYRKSFSWFLLLIFAWVPIRFLMNPIHKLGASAGGSGVSGAMPYFLYVLSGLFLVFLGACLTDREKVVQYLRWCFIFVLIIGIALLICAFNPSTQPFLRSMGFFAAGDIGDGVQRLVVLPGYGLFLTEVALCPSLFGLKWWQCLMLFTLGVAMIIVGGNRGALASVPVAVVLVLFLRRRTNALFASLCVMGFVIVGLRATIAGMADADIPPMMRSLGVFDSKIDEASGGDLSAQWRYQVWDSGIEKIKEAPLAGKGYGNLPEHLNGEDGMQSNDYETILAAGLAHNGYISAAYGFGIPFSVALSCMLVWLLIKQSVAALRTDKHDPVLRDLHAFLAGMFITYPILIYVAFDLSSQAVWIYAGISYILSNSPKSESLSISQAGGPLRKYGDETRTAGIYSSRPY
jgi:O-antigen ligase